MSGEIEEPFRLNFQADLLRSGSISFGRFESESLSWERRSVFSHNKYLEEVEKYSKPGSVTEKKAYFEAEFRRKALLKQRSSDCQDGGEFPTDRDGEFEENGNRSESPCSSNPSKCNTEIEIQHHERGDVACFDETTNSGYDEDISQHWESQLEELHPITTQDELGETHQSENENAAGNTEETIGLTLVDHVVRVDVSSEANDESSLACQTPKKDHDSISSSPRTTISPKVKPAAEKKLTRSTLKTQVNMDCSQIKVLNGASKGSMKPRISENKGLLVKKTEKKSPRPASPLIGSGVKSLKAEELRSEKAVKVKAQFPSSKKSLPGECPNVNRSKQTVNPSKPHVLESATPFGFKTNQRAENRKEFYTRIAEKIHAKEVEINQVEAKILEKQAIEMQQFRKSLNFKAKPLPSFYNEFARRSDQHKATPIRKTPNQQQPSSQAMANRHDKNPFKSSVPSNIRQSSSSSSTNRSSVIRPGSSTSSTNRPSAPLNIRPGSSTSSTNRPSAPLNIRPGSSSLSTNMPSVPLNIRPGSSTSSTNRTSVPSNIRPGSSTSLTNRPSVPSNIRPGSSTSSTNRPSVPSNIRPGSSTSSTKRPSVLSNIRPSSSTSSTYRPSVPLNIRSSSSTASTNRICFPESVGRNHVPKRKI